MADELKAKGNAAYSAGKFEEAIDFFTHAIEKDDSNHVLFSNRSACQASLKNWDAAHEDAKKCVEIKPDWPKGYSRLGGALYGKAQYEEAVDAYKKGLGYDAENATLKSGLKDAERALQGPGAAAGGGGGGMGNLFGPQFLTRLAMNPETRGFMEQPDFKAMISAVSSNPSMMGTYMHDKRFAKALEVGLGISMGMPGGDDEDGPGLGGGASSSRDAPPSGAAASKAKAPEPEPEPEVELNEEERAEKEAKEQALQEKQKGNEAYKKKDFDTAIQHYDRALELYDKDISFLTNRAAVRFEQRDYDAAIADCELAVERGRQHFADFKMIAKAMTRHGNCLIKKGELQSAIDVLNRALTEHRTADTLKLRDTAEKTLKKQQEESYVDLALADEQKVKGNEAFKESKFPEAVAFYTEALRRGPPGQWDEAYKVFSNRAACYTKLGALPEGEKDADKCIELKPDFAKGYSRKAHVQFFMKEYEKSLETYEKGLARDPGNQELKDGKQRCQHALSRFLNGTASEEEMKDRQARAMQDPDVQNIMTDPVMRQVLKECQETPASINKHMQDPMIASKLRKLMTSGIIRVA